MSNKVVTCEALGADTSLKTYNPRPPGVDDTGDFVSGTGERSKGIHCHKCLHDAYE